MSNETVTIYQVTKTRVIKDISNLFDMGYVQVAEHAKLEAFNRMFDPHAVAEDSFFKTHDLPIQLARRTHRDENDQPVHENTFFAVHIADEDLNLINLKERQDQWEKEQQERQNQWERERQNQWEAFQRYAKKAEFLSGRVQYWKDQTLAFPAAPWYRRLWMAITGRLPTPSEPALESPSAPSSPGGQPG